MGIERSHWPQIFLRAFASIIRKWDSRERKVSRQAAGVSHKSRGLNLRTAQTPLWLSSNSERRIRGPDARSLTPAFTYVYTRKSRHKCQQRNPTKDARIKISWL